MRALSASAMVSVSMRLLLPAAELSRALTS